MPAPSSLRRIALLVGRALLQRCPACGHHPLFDSWFRIKTTCPGCGLMTERGEQGYVVGAYLFNIMAAELIWLGICGAIVVSTWPDPPWNLLLYGGGALMVALPLVCYPFSKTVFLAFDLVFRPMEDRPADERMGGG